MGVHVRTTTIDIAIFKNGAEYKRVPMISGATAGADGFQASFLVDANGTTDYFEVYARQFSGSNKDISGASNLTWFQGCRVG